MKTSRVLINLAAFGLVVGFGFSPKRACATDNCTDGIYSHSNCLSLCEETYCATHLTLGQMQCNDGYQECNQCLGDYTKVQMNCVSFNS